MGKRANFSLLTLASQVILYGEAGPGIWNEPVSGLGMAMGRGYRFPELAPGSSRFHGLDSDWWTAD